MRRPRSGDHLELIGSIWHYRRSVPPDARHVFGKTVVRKSLDTSNRAEAERREKAQDVEFEMLLHTAREHPVADKRDDIKSLINDVIVLGELTERLNKLFWSDATHDQYDLFYEGPGFEAEEAFRQTVLSLTEPDRSVAFEEIERLANFSDEREGKLQKLFQELRAVITNTDDWDHVMPEYVGLIKNHYDVRRTEHTIDWAYRKWLPQKRRPTQTEDDAKRYLADFQRSARVRMLASVRRRHLTDWRDELKRDGTLADGSINHRLDIVCAVLRLGWREAELPEVDLKKLNFPEPEERERSAWKREEILKEASLLEPQSWAAWIFVLCLTDGTRLGEFVAARKEWYDPNGFINVPAKSTKMKKPHVVPVIELIRPALERHVAKLPPGAYIFDAPRPSNDKLKISHEASKWFSRFHKKHNIPKVIHELRHTWLEAARESPIKKEIYEIISGHSPKTVSDKYGGAKPSELLKANETVCEQFLKGDPELMAAIRRLVT